MPHWNDEGDEQWVCQLAGHVCTGKPTWVEHGSDLAKKLGCHGNVCEACLQTHSAPAPLPAKDVIKLIDAVQAAAAPKGPVSLYEHCRQESGLEGAALERYIQRHYGHG